MRTKRDVVLILFGLMLAWIVATLQIYANPNNWASFATWHWYDWFISAVSFGIAGLVAVILYRYAAAIDRRIGQAGTTK